MLSCQKASALIDKKSLFGLSVKEKMLLNVHRCLCDACNKYAKQSKLIDKYLHDHFHTNNENKFPLIKNKELKKQIIKKL